MTVIRLVVTLLILWGVSATNARASADREYVDALRANDARRISSLIDRVSNVDLSLPDGRTALMFAAKKSLETLVTQLLIEGADPNRRNANGGTPVMYAAIAGSVAIVRALVDAGADVNARGSNGWSAIMVAAAKGHRDLVAYLIDIEARIDNKDVYGWTPLNRAVYENRPEIVSMLLKAFPAGIEIPDDQGATALHHAAGNGFTDIVDQLLRVGANPLKKDNKKRDALDRARIAGHLQTLNLLSDWRDRQQDFKVAE